MSRPEPRPPVELRPRELAVTDIGLWRRNPYAIYAKHVLKLRKLDPLEVAPDASDRGSIIHDVLDAFVKKYPDVLPATALNELLAMGRKIFGDYKDHPEVQSFWWPRFERIAEWFIETERERREGGTLPLQTEAKGQVALGKFTLKGRADRIDKKPDGTLVISDYKTGSVPTDKEIRAGYEPQLALLALIAEQGGFKGIPKVDVSELAYWKLDGGNKGSEIDVQKDDPATQIQKSREGLEQLIAIFADPAMPYRAVPKPDLQPRYDDYAHLARLQEWGRTEKDQ